MKDKDSMNVIIFIFYMTYEHIYEFYVFTEMQMLYNFNPIKKKCQM